MLKLLPTRVVAFLSVVRYVTAVDRETCLQSALEMLNNHTLTPDHPFFYRDIPGSPPYVDASNMTLTLAGCNAICGPKRTWYHYAGPRIGGWLTPALLLLINVKVSPLGERNLLEFLHLLGDPIDSVWSLLHKIDTWDRCYSNAERHKTFCPSCQRIIATVFAGYQEMQGSRITSGRSSLEILMSRHNLVIHLNEWRRAAIDLADSRTDDMVRTLLAFVLFLYQLVGNLVPLGGGVPTSLSGSHIALSVLLSCFIPAILLTNAVGGFASPRSVHSTIANLVTRTDGPALHVADRQSFFLPGFSHLARESKSDYYTALPWAGGVDMYRPWKSHCASWERGSSVYTLSCGLLAATPVLIGFVGGSLSLWWQTPRGFNCLHICLICVSVLWIASAIITTTSYSQNFATGKYHWRLILIKDACVATFSLLMFLLTSTGIFSNCWCSSAPWKYLGIGRVILPATFFESDGKIMRPLTLSVAFLLQLFVVAFVIIHWKRGFRLLRWDEKTRQEEYDRLSSDSGSCSCMATMQTKENCHVDSMTMLLVPKTTAGSGRSSGTDSC